MYKIWLRTLQRHCLLIIFQSNSTTEPQSLLNMRITSASLTLAMTTIVCARVTEIDVSKIQARQSALGPHYINAIWTNRDIESADLGGGNQIVHGSGFALVDDAGNTIWSNAYPAG